MTTLWRHLASGQLTTVTIATRTCCGFVVATSGRAVAFIRLPGKDLGNELPGAQAAMFSPTGAGPRVPLGLLIPFPIQERGTGPMFTNALRLVLKRKLSGDPNAVLLPSIVDFAAAVVVMIALALLRRQVWPAGVLASLGVGLLQPYPFRDLKCD